VKISNLKDMEVTAENLSDERIHRNKLLRDKIAVIFGAGWQLEVVLLANRLAA
jgi:hypothetical protein